MWKRKEGTRIRREGDASLIHNIPYPHPPFVPRRGSFSLLFNRLHFANSIIDLLTLVVVSLFEKKKTLDRAKRQDLVVGFTAPSMAFSPLFKVVDLYCFRGERFPLNLDRWSFSTGWVVSKYSVMVVDLNSVKRDLFLVGLLGNE